MLALPRVMADVSVRRAPRTVARHSIVFYRYKDDGGIFHTVDLKYWHT